MCPLPGSVLCGLRSTREVLSHGYYDRLDAKAIRFPGRGGVPAAGITELNRWEAAKPRKDFTVVATPARHFSGRGLTRNATLWAPWCLRGPTHRVFFGGDSGPFAEGFRQMEEAYGPFDLTMLEIGAFDPEWADVHLGPAHALAAHRLLGGGPLPPLYWRTFNLAFHAWRQPARRRLAAAGQRV